MKVPAQECTDLGKYRPTNQLLINQPSPSIKQSYCYIKAKMEFSRIFYKELPAGVDNIFSANFLENNKVEEIDLNDQNNMLSVDSLSIQIQILMFLYQMLCLKALSDMLRFYDKERKSFDLSCRFYKESYLDVTIPKKKMS